MSQTITENIGVIGTGLVGSAITELLLEKKICITVWNRTQSKTKPLVAQGAIRADTPAEVGQQCRYVFISVMTTDVVAKLCEGPNGLLQAQSPPQYILDTTTGDPDDTIALAKRLAKRGVSFLDTTISGSSKQIRDRQSLYMVGGDRRAFEACEELLKLVTDEYVYVGPSGSGSKAKLASNVILGLNRLVLAEGLVFAEKLGLELELFLHLLKQSPAYSVAMDVKGEKMIRDDFTPQSRILQHHKDLSIVLKYADAVGQDMPLTKVHLDIMEAAIAAGDGELDNSAVIQEIRRRKHDKNC
ncbi:NAD(P)-dependent oxidoreductase [bacterium]|nr:NAD(P)-dependent oxidoreductase [bacterium]